MLGKPVLYHKFKDQKFFRDMVPIAFDDIDEFYDKSEFIGQFCSREQTIIVSNGLVQLLSEIHQEDYKVICRKQNEDHSFEFELTDNLDQALLVAPPRIQRLDNEQLLPLPIIAAWTEQGHFQRSFRDQTIDEQLIRQLYILMIDLKNGKREIKCHQRIKLFVPVKTRA